MAMLQAMCLVEYGKPMQRREAPMPKPQGSEVLVKLTHSGVCHSDVHMWDGGFDVGGVKVAAAAQPPCTLGHEMEGVPLELGPDVPAGAVDMGLPYAIFPWIGCVVSDKPCHTCKQGKEQLCRSSRSRKFTDGCSGKKLQGGFSSHVLVPHYRYLVDYRVAGIPEGLGCVYMCSGLTVFGALRKIAPHRVERGAGKDVLILGLGGLGLLGLRMAKALFKAVPLAADIKEENRKVALEFGSPHVYDPRDKDVIQKLHMDTGGGVSAVLDLVGSPISLDFAMKAVKPCGGQIVVVGMHGGQLKMPIPFIPVRELAIEGSFCGSLNDVQDMLRSLQESDLGRIPPVHTMRSIQELNEVVVELHSGKLLGRCILKHDWPTPKL
mmetsp:Transcript_54205/g.100160  ORF Transcript_54205/g.100160 Transcript_54205/m.100160 type:complete len:379 (+) Transcript_54205:58-1194(+)